MKPVSHINLKFLKESNEFSANFGTYLLYTYPVTDFEILFSRL